MERSTAEAVEIVYRTHGCSCEEHPSNGASAACAAWRRRAAEQVAAALRPVEDGGLAMHPCPDCATPIPASHRLCMACAIATVSAAS